jgi:hypothetical protein
MELLTTKTISSRSNRYSYESKLFKFFTILQGIERDDPLCLKIMNFSEDSHFRQNDSQIFLTLSRRINGSSKDSLKFPDGKGTRFLNGEFQSL